MIHRSSVSSPKLQWVCDRVGICTKVCWEPKLPNSSSGMKMTDARIWHLDWAIFKCEPLITIPLPPPPSTRACGPEPEASVPIRRSDSAYPHDTWREGSRTLDLTSLSSWGIVYLVFLICNHDPSSRDGYEAIKNQLKKLSRSFFKPRT